MSLENYTVAVKLSLVENVSKGLVTLAGKFSVLNKQADIFNAKLQSLKSQIATGGMMVGAGTAIAAPFIYATLQASKLQQQLKMVQIATSATDQQMDQFRITLDKIGSSSIFNAVDVAKIAKIISTSGNFTTAQVQQLVPSFVQFAQSQNLLKGTSYEKSTEQGIKLAEITGNFDPESIKASLNAFTKLSLLMPGSVDKVLGAFKYAQGTLTNIMGVKTEQNLLLVAMFQRMGIEGTRAGSQLLSAITRSIPGVMGSGLWTGKSLGSLTKMGMVNGAGQPTFFTDGKFDALKWMHLLGDYIQKEFKSNPKDPGTARANIMKTLQFALGTGTRVAALLSSSKAIKQYEEIDKAYQRMPNLDQMNESMGQLMNKQLPEAFSNISRLFTSLGYALLPSATSGLRIFNDQIKKLIDYIDTHQDFVAKIEKIILSIAGLTVVGGLLLIVKAGLTGLLIPFRMFTSSIALMELVMSPFIVAIGGMTAGILLFMYGAYKTYETLKSINWANLWKEIKDQWSLFSKSTMELFSSFWNSIKMYIHDFIDSIMNKLGIKHTVKSGSITNPAYRQELSYIRGNTHTSNMRHSGPINVNLHHVTNLDGKKIASSVVTHVVNQAYGVPNTGSSFDTNLSNMPYVANAIGLGS